MVHLRIVAPEAEAQKALALFEKTDSVYNIIVLEDAARKPDGHAILCDVAREDASVVIADLKELDIHHCGSIAIEDIDSQISDVAFAAEKAAQASQPTRWSGRKSSRGRQRTSNSPAASWRSWSSRR
jgi:hypothetical protein